MSNPKIIEHARNPRNWGELEDANGVLISVRECGDIIMFFVRIDGDRLEKVRFMVQGCQNLIACCSVVSMLAEGKPVWDAMQITPEDVERALGGLPPEEKHAAEDAVNALYAAIQDYLSKRREAGASLCRGMSGEGWRALYIQAQKGEEPLPNLIRSRERAQKNRKE
ncbi:MAG: iron-sulfur cluster assembly scaffold protein [Thermacetogeniaceae bacterium]